MNRRRFLSFLGVAPIASVGAVVVVKVAPAYGISATGADAAVASDIEWFTREWTKLITKMRDDIIAEISAARSPVTSMAVDYRIEYEGRP